MIQPAMSRYASDEYEDLDEYEEDGEDEEGGYEEEEECEQEETHEPSMEELEYLELRQKLKERFRKKMKKEMGTGSASSSRNIKSSSSKDNFGSFFGPSQPVIAQRVIQESKSLLENPDLADKVMRKNIASGNKVHASNSARPKSSTSNHAPKVSNGVKTKIQMLKNTRDYSFLLSDDADVPAPSKASLPQKSSAPNAAQFVPRERNPSSSSTGRKLPNSHDGRKPLPGGVSQMKPKAAIQKNVSVSKQSQPAREPKKEPIRSNGSVRGQPMASKNHPLKSSTGMNERKSSTLDVKRPMPNLPRPNPSKQQPSISKQALVQKKMPQQSSKPKMIQKQAMPSSRPPVAMQKHAVPSSKPQVVMQKRVVPSSRPPQIKQPPPVKNPAQRPAKRPMKRWDDEEEDGAAAISMIRQMFGYNPNRYRDDDDVSDMEAGFDDILKEERRSAKIAREEDEEELRKIEEEERREQMRRQAKKRKIER
ncbi:PREDICTED: protein SPT2 homolog isoform X2 [Ipomoea nil]|uniref:protein SPT2 homolog isoform X2 n=1 Tax=Ipomoea nil TaxID=35883 RepID=UPI000901AC81|nr:PREDICTED: protein SPT2 homolog isoform X2 [Ipomoea nil]